MKKEYLEGGAVRGAHGVRGVLKIEPWCDTPRVLATKKRVFLASKEGGYKEYKVLTASVNGPGVLMSLEGIDSREAAIALRDAVIYLKREDIALRRGQMFLADMIGLPVTDAESGRVYGKIKGTLDAPRGVIYEIETESGVVLLPSVPEFIKEIDAERGMLVTPIPGFFD